MTKAQIEILKQLNNGGYIQFGYFIKLRDKRGTPLKKIMEKTFYAIYDIDYLATIPEPKVESRKVASYSYWTISDKGKQALSQSLRFNGTVISA